MFGRALEGVESVGSLCTEDAYRAWCAWVQEGLGVPAVYAVLSDTSDAYAIPAVCPSKKCLCSVTGTCIANDPASFVQEADGQHEYLDVSDTCEPYAEAMVRWL